MENACPPSDRALVAAAVHNRAAFTELYRRHVERVYRYLFFRVGSIEDAEDLTAQTFLAAFEQLETYRGEGSFSAWLLGIARYKAMDHFRREHKTLPLDHAAEIPSPHPSPEATVTEWLRRERLLQALRHLTPERAEALSLRFFAGLNNGEVAEVMGKSEAAVKMLVHRGVQDLRRWLVVEIEEER